MRRAASVWLLTLVGVGCQDATTAGGGQPGAPDQAASDAPASCDSGPLSNAEKIRAATLIQRLLSASHGKVVVSAIQLVSGVIRATATPAIVGARSFPIYVTRDLRIVFPASQDATSLPPQARAAGAYESCLRASGLRLFGDAKQAATQRQLKELGDDAAALLVNCAEQSADCATLGQTTLPVLRFGAQRISSFMPRKVIAEWTKCPPQ